VTRKLVANINHRHQRTLYLGANNDLRSLFMEQEGWRFYEKLRERTIALPLKLGIT
jgi:hypothetical protein